LTSSYSQCLETFRGPPVAEFTRRFAQHNTTRCGDELTGPAHRTIRWSKTPAHGHIPGPARHLTGMKLPNDFMYVTTPHLASVGVTQARNGATQEVSTLLPPIYHRQHQIGSGLRYDQSRNAGARTEVDHSTIAWEQCIDKGACMLNDLINGARAQHAQALGVTEHCLEHEADPKRRD
jgi:hypothetical protein